MNHSFVQPTTNQYFTPKKHTQTTDKHEYFKSEKSTVERYYDLEESFKKYEQLLEENLYLKNLMIKEHLASQAHALNDTFRQIPHEEFHSMKQGSKMSRNNSQKCLNLHNTQSTEMNSYQDTHYNSFAPSNDVRMWSLKHRNSFLEQKLGNLQQQYHRQNEMIHKVKTSEKWRNRFDCKQSTCYQDKYIKLLRIKSPVLLD